MCSLKLPEDIDWIDACDNYDRKHQFATWYSADETRSLRYYTISNECGLWVWNFQTGKWIMDKELPVAVHDPVEIKHLAERMLR